MSVKSKNTLKGKIEKIPKKPGIYFFKDRSGTVIYIGKARCLKDRVKSYFLPVSESKVRSIIQETSDIDCILTGSEREAAFLENNFIRQHQPKYNLRLKDDKSFPYLKITVREQFPAVSLTRKVEADEARYFGPFTPAHRARQTIQLLNKFFGIRGCEEPVPGKRKRPCLDYDLNLCAAPCTGNVSEPEYRERVRNSLLFLEGKVEELLSIIKRQMQEAASLQEYEQAARWRDLIHTIEQVKDKPKLISVGLENKDIFGFSAKKDAAALYVFQMRKGKVIESKGLLLQKQENVLDKEILFSALQDYFRRQKNLPEKILLPFDFPGIKDIQKSLPGSIPGKISIRLPQKGKDKKLVDLAAKNAEILLMKEEETAASQEKIQEILGLAAPPQRIEGFDISNIGGEESVGSLVVFEQGLPQKKDYRKFKIQTVRGPNDVACLQEVLRRRYSRLTEKKEPLPDLILVDGGKGQLHAALTALRQFGLSRIPVASLAKKEEIIFSPGHENGIRLERTSSALKLFQRIRNEAHRFAVTFHRQLREKRSFESLMDGIPGIGTKRKASLLSKYKNIDAIQNAPAKELIEIVGKKAAQALHKRLKAIERE